MSTCEDVARGAVARPQQLLITTLINTYANWFLLGFILKQTYDYNQRSRQMDTLWLRLLVLGTIAIQLIDSFSVIFTGYGLAAQRWGNPQVFFQKGRMIISNLCVPTLAIAGALTQGFYVWRIWNFSGAVGTNMLKIASRIISAFILLLSVCCTSCFLALFVAVSL